MANQDRLHRFIFEQLDVRGELVQMDASWQAVLAYSDTEHQLNSYMAFYLHRSTPRSIRVTYNSANR